MELESSGCPSAERLSRAKTGYRDAEVSAHLERCAICAAQWSSMQRIDELTRAIAAPVVDLDRARKVREAIVADPAPVRLTARRRSIARWASLGVAGFAAAAAAAVLLVRPHAPHSAVVSRPASTASVAIPQLARVGTDSKLERTAQAVRVDRGNESVTSSAAPTSSEATGDTPSPNGAASAPRVVLRPSTIMPRAQPASSAGTPAPIESTREARNDGAPVITDERVAGAAARHPAVRNTAPAASGEPVAQSSAALTQTPKPESRQPASAAPSGAGSSAPDRADHERIRERQLRNRERMIERRQERRERRFERRVR